MVIYCSGFYASVFFLPSDSTPLAVDEQPLKIGMHFEMLFFSIGDIF